MQMYLSSLIYGKTMERYSFMDGFLAMFCILALLDPAFQCF